VGQRGRKRGVTNAALRAARAAAQQTDQRCADIAQHVYAVARELKDDPEAEAMPLEVLAPAVAAAERAAYGAAAVGGLDNSDQRVLQDVASYLVFGFREIAAGFDVEHFEAWRKHVDGRLPSAPDTTTSRTTEEATSGSDGQEAPPADDAGTQREAADGGPGKSQPDQVGAGEDEGGGEGGQA
jgi:hypothetical protein